MINIGEKIKKEFPHWYFKNGNLKNEFERVYELIYLVNKQIVLKEPSRIHTTHIKGKGSYSTTKFHHPTIADFFKKFNKNLIVGNDAKRGGAHGYHVELTVTEIRKLSISELLQAA